MTEMNDLDRALSSDSVVTPSRRFHGDTMSLVRAAATEPPPLAFPWTRVLTGALASAVAGVSLAAELSPETSESIGHIFDSVTIARIDVASVTMGVFFAIVIAGVPRPQGGLWQASSGSRVAARPPSTG